MSEIDEACRAYAAKVAEPWSRDVSGSERLWMLTYRPQSERQLRQRLPMCQTVTEAAGHRWQLIDVTTTFESWLAQHEYRSEYLRDPQALRFGALDDFADCLVDQVASQLSEADKATVSALLGSGALFGLIPVARLLHGVVKNIPGRMLVLHPEPGQGPSFSFRAGTNWV